MSALAVLGITLGVAAVVALGAVGVAAMFRSTFAYDGQYDEHAAAQAAPRRAKAPPAGPVAFKRVAVVREEAEAESLV